MAIKDLVPRWHRKRDGLPSLQREADPFAQIQSEMNRLFEDLFSLTGTSAPTGATAWALPRVDVVEDDKEVTVTAELPGMEEKDIQIEMDDATVTLHGEKHAEQTDRKRNWSRRELHYGAFHRVIQLPQPVDGSKAKARFRKGVLCITAPKRETAPARNRIPIQTG